MENLETTQSHNKATLMYTILKDQFPPPPPHTIYEPPL